MPQITNGHFLGNALLESSSCERSCSSTVTETAKIVRLREAKEMLDGELMSQADYNGIKDRIFGEPWANCMNKMARLTELKQMRSENLIDDSDFVAKKNEVIASI